MKLPSLSSSMYVARLRYIQSIHEPLERRNPDTLVRHFIPMLQRWRAVWLGKSERARLRAQPFYNYLIARTKYYDQVVGEAVSQGARRILMVGCGSDTRAYRFQNLLRSQGVQVLECDQAEAIVAKERMARRWRASDYVSYLPIDLNDGDWPRLALWLGNKAAPKTLVLIEGVSPYINDVSFGQFLQLLAATLPSGSRIAYDFKIRGVEDELGRAARTQKPFRLSCVREEVEAFHRQHGLRLDRLELSSKLCARLLPGVKETGEAAFQEDGLVMLQQDRD